ncbi:helix-turn-helix domain-containing protein [Paenibacillus xylanexedens]|uniref:helix-turn-helix domain-containing protein n=1 Tax=Paenibacillus xylanexedens TaxID=528191 RepID=UPI003C6E3DFB
MLSLIPANSIREQLTQYIDKNSMTLSRFSEVSGINTGTISRILHGNRPISVSQLIAISSGMGVAADHFFADYVEECFAYSVSMRRIRPFILRSAELNRLDCIEQILYRLLDDLDYATELFEMAEQLFEQNQRSAAALLYKSVSEVEKYQHSERLAMCQYRMFLIGQGENLEENLRMAILFEPYVDRLDEGYQLDALKHLIHVFMAVHKWDKVDNLAQEMYKLAKIFYESKHLSKRREHHHENHTERPLYTYILYAWLIRSTVYEEYGDYNKALEFVSLYAYGQGWLQEQDEESERIQQQFGEWATANTYLYRMLSGEREIVHEYADYISKYPDEIFLALRYMIQAANRFDWNIDDILDRFSEHTPLRTYKTEFGDYNKRIINESYARFLSDLGMYQLKRDRNDAMNLILEGLQMSVKINSDRNIITCMTLFEQYRDQADSEAKQKFKSLSSEVQRLNAKKNVFVANHF